MMDGKAFLTEGLKEPLKELIYLHCAQLNG